MSGEGITRERLAEELGLSAEQRDAIGLEQDAVIAAGAGAGKTTTLVGAVAYDLLIGGVPAERLCVCTFTRAAAGNLRSRLDAALERLVGGRAPDLDRLWIGTIDALFSRLLRENALAAGVPPGFRVADDRDLVALRQEAAGAALERLTDRELAEMDRVLDVASRDDLARTLAGAYERSRTLEIGLPRDWIPVLAAPESAIQALRELLEVATEKEAEKIERDIALIAADRLEGLSKPGSKWGMRESSRTAGRLEAAVEARDSWRQARADAELAGAREALERAFELYAAEYAERKRAEELLDFSDLDDRAEELAAAGAAPGFLRTYIDEAQDTNPRQYRILRALSAGPVISIGDRNQSIYSFRGADVEVFRREVAKAERRISLSDNYRSRPEVLEVVNGLCERVPALADGLIRMRSAGPNSQLEPLGEPAVEALCFTLKERQMPSAAKEAAVAAPHIVAAAERRGIALSDVCILVRDNSEVGAYAAALRELGVPALAIQKKGLFEQPEVLDVLAYLRLLADPDDEEALLRVLSSPFCGLSDAELFIALEHRAAELRRLRAELGRDPSPEHDDRYPRLGGFVAAERPQFWAAHEEIIGRRRRGSPAALLRRAIEAHGFDLALEALDETGARWRNVEKLLALIGDLERGAVGASARALSERLELERAANQEGQDDRRPSDIDAVRVMTVHQAKGDEFKLVAVGRLSRRHYSPSQALVVDRQGRIGLRRGSGDSALQDSAHKDHYEAEAKRKDEEGWRILYVALTRAEEHLLLIAAGREGKDGEACWNEPFTQLVAPEEIPAEPGGESLVARGDGELLVRRIDPEQKPQGAAPRARARRGADELEGELAVTEAELPAIAAGPLSYTSLAAWRRCPLRRWIEHDLALRRLQPLEEGDAGAEGEPGGAREFGSEIHRALARLDFAEGADPASALRGGALDGDERALAMLEELVCSPLAARIREARSCLREVRFELVLAGWLLQGQIDLVARLGEEALVVDWKSGEDPDDVFGADYALQRRLYSLAVLSSEDPPARVRAVSYPLAGGAPIGEDYELEGLDELRARLAAEIDRILSAKPAAAAQGDPEPFCLDCPGLQRLCPLSGIEELRAAS